jgi:hypothetical protein
VWRAGHRVGRPGRAACGAATQGGALSGPLRRPWHGGPSSPPGHGSSRSRPASGGSSLLPSSSMPDPVPRLRGAQIRWVRRAAGAGIGERWLRPVDGLGRPEDGLIGPVHAFFLFLFFYVDLPKRAGKPPIKVTINHDLWSVATASVNAFCPPRLRLM